MATRRQRTWFAHPCPSLYPRPALSSSLPVSPRRLGHRKTAAAGRQPGIRILFQNQRRSALSPLCSPSKRMAEGGTRGWLALPFLGRLFVPSASEGSSSFRPLLPTRTLSPSAAIDLPLLPSFPASVLPSAQSLPINEGLNRRPLGQTDSPSLLLSPLFPSLPPPCSRNVRDLARDLLRAAAPSEHVCLVDRT